MPGRLVSGWGVKAHTDVRLTRTGVVVEQINDGIGRRFENDIPLDRFEPADWEQLAELMREGRARVFLEPPQVHVTELRLPAAARTRLRSAITLQLPEILPLDPDLVVWAYGRPRMQGDRLDVDIVFGRRSDLDELEAALQTFDLDAQFVGKAGEELITLGSVRSSSRRGLSAQLSKEWLAAISIIASLPITLLGGAMLLGWSNAAAVDVLKRQVEPKIERQRQFDRNEALREALAPLVAIPTASMLLDDLANRLPRSVHLKNLGYQHGGTTALDAVAADPDIVASALESDPLLPNFTQIGQTPAEQNGIDLSYRAGR